MVFHSTYLLLNSKSGLAWKSGAVKFYIVYGFAMVILTTFEMNANHLMGELMWIEHRNAPGGPFVYYSENSTLWFNILGTTSCMVGNYLNDALLVLSLFPCHYIYYPNLFFGDQLYRLYIIYSGDWRVVIAPFLLYLATIGISIFILNDDQMAYSHQTSHVFNSPDRKRFASLQLLCNKSHRLCCSMAVADKRP